MGRWIRTGPVLARPRPLFRSYEIGEGGTPDYLAISRKLRIPDRWDCRCARHGRQPWRDAGRIQPIEEKGDNRAQLMPDIEQAPGTDAVGAGLVVLDL